MTQESERYNGWSNWATWCVHLHLTNTERTQAHCEDRARFWREQDSTSEHWTQEQSAKFNLADELKPWVENEIYGSMDLDTIVDSFGDGVWPLLARDAIQGMIDDADWHEIAAAFLTAD